MFQGIGWDQLHVKFAHLVSIVLVLLFIPINQEACYCNILHLVIASSNTIADGSFHWVCCSECFLYLGFWWPYKSFLVSFWQSFPLSTLI
jgi:hypothetical protein